MIAAVVQARIRSTRLPGKVVADLCGHPLLWHVLQRARRARTLQTVVLATTCHPDDDALIDIGRQCAVHVYRGSEDDVLDRLYQAVRSVGADVVVRLTADCPLLDPAVIDRAVTELLRDPRLDYVGTGPEFPEGLDVEVCRHGALERAWREATRPHEREHPTAHIAFSGKFQTKRLGYEQDLSRYRWVVDEERDLTVVRALYEELFPTHGHDFRLADVLALVDRQPGLADGNRDIRRNEWFLNLPRTRAEKAQVRPRPLAASDALWRRATRVIPAGTQTFSKGPTQYVDGVAPKFLVRGSGSRVWDADGNEYIDFPMGLGAIILGHGYPVVVDAVAQQLGQGVSMSLMHPLEVTLAELLTDVIPSAEMVRFGKNGSDATAGAVRAARAYTAREHIAHCGYHGWQDWYIAGTSRHRGVPRSLVGLQHAFAFGDLASLARVFDEHPGKIAAVVMEPLMSDVPREGFLQEVRDLTHREGALLVFDEVATGFRFDLGGAQAYFGVTPDLACFGKAMGNGMPISCIVGRREIMAIFDEVFFSFTFGGECLSLAAAVATIKEMQREPVIPHLWTMGRRLQDGFNALSSNYALRHTVECVGLAPRSVMVFRETAGIGPLLLKSLFQQEALKRGVLFSGAHCLSYSHTEEDIDTALGAYQEALEVLIRAIDAGSVAPFLEGRPVEPVFRPL